MRSHSHRDQLRRWWEFACHYQLLSPRQYSHSRWILSKISDFSIKDSQAKCCSTSQTPSSLAPLNDPSVQAECPALSFEWPYFTSVSSNQPTSHTRFSETRIIDPQSAHDPQQPPSQSSANRKYHCDKSSRVQYSGKQGSGSRQNQSKRQREWIYLCHYIAINGLNPLHIISGQDDGREPDFTLIFYQQSRLYYVGVELTTLPRLRDQMGEKDLIAKRWYWQGLQVMAKRRQKQPSFQRFRLPVKTLYMPTDTFNQRLKHLPRSIISQSDIDAVMKKKAHKVSAYVTRRPLDELWLLVHTDKFQPDSILTDSHHSIELYHRSNFDQVHVTRYPSHKIIQVINA